MENENENNEEGYDPEDAGKDYAPTDSIYEDMTADLFVQETDIEKKHTNEIEIKDLQDHSDRVWFHSGTNDSYQVRLKNQKGERSLPPPCKFYAQGFCRNDQQCRFFHAPQSSSLSMKRKPCQMQHCCNIAKVDICNLCIAKLNLCAKRPCKNERSGEDPEPSLCSSCYEQESSSSRSHARMCANPQCCQPCLSIHKYCRDCFSRARRPACGNRKCSNRVQNPNHRYCASCFTSSRSSYEPRRRSNSGGSGTNSGSNFHHPYKKTRV